MVDDQRMEGEQDLTEEQVQEHMTRLRQESISKDFDRILERLKGSTLYGEVTDLGDLQELVIVAYALGRYEGAQQEIQRQRFKYTRPQVSKPPGGIIIPKKH